MSVRKALFLFLCVGFLGVACAAQNFDKVRVLSLARAWEASQVLDEGECVAFEAASTAFKEGPNKTRFRRNTYEAKSRVMGREAMLCTVLVSRVEANPLTREQHNEVVTLFSQQWADARGMVE